MIINLFSRSLSVRDTTLKVVAIIVLSCTATALFTASYYDATCITGADIDASFQQYMRGER